MGKARSALEQLRRRALLPPREGWLSLFAAPVSYGLVVVCIATALAKAAVLYPLEGLSSVPQSWLWAVGGDLFLFFGVIALFSLAETRRRWIAIPVRLFALVFIALGAINAAHLFVTGEPLDRQVVETGIERFGDAWNIAVEAISQSLLWTLIAVAAIAVVPTTLRRKRFRKAGAPLHTRGFAHARARCAACVAAVGLLVWVALPRPEAIQAAKLGLGELFASEARSERAAAPDANTTPRFTGYDPEHIVSPDSIDSIRSGARPDVLIVVMESLRFDHTELAHEAIWRGTRTPHLRRLAERGTSFTKARAVIPHTTKSLFSILCGRHPALQTEILETAANLPVQCLGDVLREAGYRTAFFQSALGHFEERPRLVAKLGFEDFFAYEDIQGEKIGYLGSDDESLAEPFARWLARSDGPFFATLLTSGAHHPYRLSQRIERRVEEEGIELPDAEARYARLIEAGDRLLGEVLDTLEGAGRLADTLVVVVGDHGEGFGIKGVRQHDKNYYEEGLRVPFVVAGPGVPVREVSDNASLSDVTPTLLGRLGVAVAEDARDNTAGLDLFSGEVPEDRLLVFACWYQRRCSGFVTGDDKVVFTASRRKVGHFDLAQDPEERNPGDPPARLREAAVRAGTVLMDHENLRFRPTYEQVRIGEWVCPENIKMCVHPKGRQIPGLEIEQIRDSAER